MRWGIAAILFLAAPALTQSSADARDRKAMITESIRNYSGNCPFPYHTVLVGRSYGQRSAYSKPGGASLLYFDWDMSGAMLANWRARQQ